MQKIKGSLILIVGIFVTLQTANAHAQVITGSMVNNGSSVLYGIPNCLDLVDGVAPPFVLSCSDPTVGGPPGQFWTVTHTITINGGELASIICSGDYGGCLDGNVSLGATVSLAPKNLNDTFQQWIPLNQGDGYVLFQNVGTGACLADGYLVGFGYELAVVTSCNSADLFQQWSYIVPIG